MSLLLLSIFNALGLLALTFFVIYSKAGTRRTELKQMADIDNLETAVDKINAETSALGQRVTEIQKELSDALASNDSARIQAATAKLSAIASTLDAMAQPTASGGVSVPSGQGTNGVIIGGDSGGDSGGASSGGSATGATPVNQPPQGQGSDASSTSGASGASSTGTASGGSDAGAASAGGTGAGAEKTGVVITDGGNAQS